MPEATKPDTGHRVTQNDPVCTVCRGTGLQPGTNIGEPCGNCQGFGRTGAKKTDDPAFVDSHAGKPVEKTGTAEKPKKKE